VEFGLISFLLLIYIFIKHKTKIFLPDLPKNEKLEKSNFRSRNLLFLLLIFLGFFYFYIGLKLIPFTDRVYFGGDSDDYQSLAVNFAAGHGIQRSGGLELFTTYKFEEFENPPAHFDTFMSTDRINLYRTPAYPLFLGIIYRLFGISPYIAKVIQYLLLVIIASSLPLIGYHYWGKTGIIAGIPAGGLFLVTNYDLAMKILTECLVAFAVFLFLCVFIFYEKRRSLFSGCLLGLSMGFSLLVKGSLIFIPILTILWIAILFIKKRDIKILYHLLIIGVSTIIIVLPWTIFASVNSGKLTILSTQGPFLLLDDNNELCIDGGWHNEWRDNKNSFYLNDGIEVNQAVRKVINFYWHNPKLFPRCMVQKLLKGYKYLPFFWIFSGLALIEEVLRFLHNRKNINNLIPIIKKERLKIPISIWIISGNFF